MKNVIGLSILLTLSLCLGCYDDKGNYDYHDFNEVTIGNRGFDTAYLLTSYVDTLRISPELEFKLEENKHLTYEWVARSNAVGFVEYPISNDRNLVYPMSLSAGGYTLFFKVKDTLNTMEYSNATAFQVQDLLTKGWVILGENSNGEAQMDMITYSVDTMVLKNILQESGLPVLKDPVKVWVVDNYVDNMIHVSTGDGTYRLNREDFKGGDHTHLKYNFFDPGSLEHFTLQDVAQIRNYNRVAIIDDVLFHNSSMIQSSIFQNPANHYKGSYDLFDVGDKIAYNPQAMAFIYILYNKTEQRFVYAGGRAYGSPAGRCDTLKDTREDVEIFSWKTGLDYVTSINSRFLDGYSYTILKDDEGHRYLYSYVIMYQWGWESVVKKKKYLLDKATDFDKAKFFGASAQRTYLIYATGSKLYAYDYVAEKVQLLQDFGDQEITLLHCDLLVETGAGDDFFYVGTYDPSLPKETGGTLTKYRVVNDPNNIIVEKVPGFSWSGLCKIKSIDFKKN